MYSARGLIYVAVTKLLLKLSQHNFHAKDKDEWTALIYAAITNQPEAVKILIGLPGIDDNATGVVGRTQGCSVSRTPT
jgi:ankyrin repeat protein